MADSKRKRKRPSAAISIYRGDEDDKDGDEDATMNRDMTFSRRHGRLGQSSGAIPADNPIPAQEPPAADTLEWFYDDNMDNPSVDTPTTTGTSKTKTTDEQKVCRICPLLNYTSNPVARQCCRNGFHYEACIWTNSFVMTAVGGRCAAWHVQMIREACFAARIALGDRFFASLVCVIVTDYCRFIVLR